MIIISHRINSKKLLEETPSQYGVEVDIRTYNDELIINHEPYTPGESFEDWLNFFAHETLILNVKEDGLEERLLALMKKHNINDFFFLDQSFPSLIKTSKLSEKRCAVRVSEFESIGTALALSGRIEWVWVDCFSQFPLSLENANQLHTAGFKLCFVSPELQRKSNTIEIQNFRQEIQERNIKGDAVCTKLPELWL